jgi:hypothetical protein
MTIWHMHNACWITKATNTHSDYVVLIAFPLQQWLHICSSVFHYMYIVLLTSILCECVVWCSSASWLVGLFLRVKWQMKLHKISVHLWKCRSVCTFNMMQYLGCVVRTCLGDCFCGWWIGCDGPQHWPPPRSSDLQSPLFFFMWGHMKHLAYQKKVGNSSCLAVSHLIVARFVTLTNYEDFYLF